MCLNVHNKIFRNFSTQDITGWGENDRGVSYTFGPDIVQSMTEKFGIDLVCRAHQVSPLSLSLNTRSTASYRWLRMATNSSTKDRYTTTNLQRLSPLYTCCLFAIPMGKSTLAISKKEKKESFTHVYTSKIRRFIFRSSVHYFCVILLDYL